MALIVQKYGGTSVGSPERIQAVATRVKEAVAKGNRVVVIVSAMGKTTDGLVKLATELTSNPSRREMDMLLATGEQVTIALLSMALQEIGQPAISLTGAQVGIVTEAEHTRARILEIKTDRITRHLDEGKVVVVAGFQGISATDDLEITTLGRGGSDTSAVALAAALQADCCEIYTDVPGILTTDPRLVPQAQLMAEITCDEMLELASLGAKVLHPRAVEIAKNYGVPLAVRSSWSDEPGTMVTSDPLGNRSLAELEIGRPVDAIEFDKDQAKVVLLRVRDRPGIASHLFGTLADTGVDVDLIVQSIHEGNTNDIAFTVSRADLKRAEAVAAAASPALAPEGSVETASDGEIAKVAIVGAGTIGRPGVAAQMFQTLADNGINIQMISTSEVKVSCIIDAEDCDRATAALCRAFEVPSVPVASHAPVLGKIVRGVALDLNRARIAIRQVPDRPGMAAAVFGLLAENNICVDMIVQSQRTHIIDDTAKRDIIFVVGINDLHDAVNKLEEARSRFGYGDIVADEALAKVSIVGAGMLGAPGVAAKMFRALADRGINIDTIATSEIKISCLVSRSRGVEALQIVHAAFDLEGSDQIEVPA